MMQSKSAKKAMTLLIALLLTSAVSGCVNGPAIDAWCLIESPKRPSNAEIDRMNDAQVKGVLAHNEYGAKHCGWRP